MDSFSIADERLMRHALRLAALGRGLVEPNPMVGCVVAHEGQIVAEGWHQRFGGPHAEVNALREAGAAAAGATLYVTLEPCCHKGKTPPCTESVIQSGIARVVVAQHDPFEQVRGQGVSQLKQAGLKVSVGLLEADARRLNAPYLKRLGQHRPWVIAKWAMTLDGKIASCRGASQWISGEASRGLVHQLRGRVDAIMVGSHTALRDDPLLTARPAGPRTAARIVVDSQARLPLNSRLVQSVDAVPVIVAVSSSAPLAACQALRQSGCEVLNCTGDDHLSRLLFLLDELGRRNWTNLLVEGGGRLLGNLLQLDQIDEVHVFVAPTLIGGAAAPSPIEGPGRELLAEALRLDEPAVRIVGDDVYISGHVLRTSAPPP
jgi:diaminohydroxyphosphoribosylaminopyrimidine deaminase/5-amino-6-(5-phosphoribosylamino)uracil reductase